tara:strand:- start:3843 stop:6344 length:2502 start_codon:yes stop_codon:yes gene_type:complete
VKTLIIAEKPSVAKDLAKALGKVKKQGDFFENDELIISSAVGHLVELFMPEDVDKKFKRWMLGSLPIIPEKFELKPIEKTKKKFQELKKLMQRKDVDKIINACDAGREGELIFTYIYELAKCKKPVQRMWMMSMTESGIQESFAHLRSQDEMVPLQSAARCRSESDWIVGINGTRAVTLRMFGGRAGQVATVGRVQTPTLSLVVQREREIRAFKPRDYWRIIGNFGIHAGTYEGTFQKKDFKKGTDEHDRIDRIWEKAEAERILEAVKNTEMAAVTEEKKRTRQQAPRLYDLTSLQREANSRFGFSAGRTLQLAQALYEKHKMITYPRTDSRALPEDYIDTCRKTLKQLSDQVFGPHAEKVLAENWVVPNKRIFNNKQVSDHFAIIPTDQSAKKLSEEEAKIYDMIARRFIAIFFPPAEYDVTTRMSEAGEHTFKTEGKVLAKPGWLTVYGKEAQDKDTLPPLSSEDGTPAQAKVLEVELLDEQTKPPPRYSEATLLAAMEGAGKLVEDEELAEAMKEKGLGTPATRAQTIDHLIREKYMERIAREIHPTVKAENLIEFLEAIDVESLRSPTMTGEWEHKLHQIQQGKLSRETFMKEISSMTKRIVERIRAFDEMKAETKQTEIISPTDNKPLIETLRSFRSQDGKVTLYKTIGNRRMKPDEIGELLTKKRIGPLDDFRSKAGKPFSAILELDEEFKTRFVFESNDRPEEDADGNPIDLKQFEAIGACPKAAKGLCAHQEGTIRVTPNAYTCEHYAGRSEPCNFRVSRTLLGRTIPEDQFKKLLTEGKTDLLDKFRSNRTKRFFSAHLILKDNGEIGFEFAKKEAGAKKSKAK